MYQHIPVGVICLDGMPYKFLAPALFKPLGKNFQPLDLLRPAFQQAHTLQNRFLSVPGLCAVSHFSGPSCPQCKQTACLERLLHTVRSIGVKFYILYLRYPLVPVLVFPAVTGKRIHIVHPPVRRNYLQPALHLIVAYQTERQRDIELEAVRALSQQTVGRKYGRMLH